MPQVAKRRHTRVGSAVTQNLSRRQRETDSREDGRGWQPGPAEPPIPARLPHIHPGLPRHFYKLAWCSKQLDSSKASWLAM